MARPGLTGHRKFRRLAKSLGSAITARGALELLWEPCYESGDEYVGTSDDIETLVGWTGVPGMLTRALAEAGAPEGQGFIEPVNLSADSPAQFSPDTRYRIHDLWHHAPDYVTKRRKRELERQQKSGPTQAVPQTAPNGGQRTETSTWQIEVDRPPAPAPAPAPAPKKTSPEPPGDSAPPVLTFPTVGPHDASWALRTQQLAEWRECFPSQDVLAECRKALAWILANPGRKKTARGMPKFLVGWLSRANDRGRPETPTRRAAEQAPAYLRGWQCDHVDKCSHSTMCANKHRFPEKYPLKAVPV